MLPDPKQQQKVFAAFLASQNPTIVTDPLSIPSTYDDPKNIEVVALIASVFAFGNVKSFLPLLESMKLLWSNHPHAYFLHKKFAGQKDWEKYYYRWYRSDDILALFEAISIVLKKHTTLRDHAFSIYRTSDSFEEFLFSYAADWRRILLDQRVSRATQFMIPDPTKKSTMKRLLMFIRWMSNPSKPDFGLWTFIPPEDLWIALDTHMGQFATQFGWITKNQRNLQAVKQVSQWISTIYPDDPMKVDFVLTQYAITGQCLHKWKRDLCEPCQLRNICSVAR